MNKANRHRRGINMVRTLRTLEEQVAGLALHDKADRSVGALTNPGFDSLVSWLADNEKTFREACRKAGVPIVSPENLTLGELAIVANHLGLKFNVTVTRPCPKPAPPWPRSQEEVDAYTAGGFHYFACGMYDANDPKWSGTASYLPGIQSFGWFVVFNDTKIIDYWPKSVDDVNEFTFEPGWKSRVKFSGVDTSLLKMMQETPAYQQGVKCAPANKVWDAVFRVAYRALFSHHFGQPGDCERTLNRIFNPPVVK